jgi:hypothetical protein
MNEKGSSSSYDAMNRLIPKTRKKEANRTNRICPIHHKIFSIGIILKAFFYLKKKSKK